MMMLVKVERKQNGHGTAYLVKAQPVGKVYWKQIAAQRFPTAEAARQWVTVTYGPAATFAPWSH